MELIDTLAEEMLGVRLKLLQAKNDRHLKSLIVTGADHDEGVTSVASSLAIALARDQQSVLLADANIRQPGLHSLFGLPREVGFVDFISGKANLDMVVKKTSYPKLKVITSGVPPEDNTVTAYFSVSGEIKKSVEANFDWVVYDSAPANSFPDTLLTVALRDGALLVVRSEKTRWQSVKKAKENLESMGTNILGIILNRHKHIIPRFIYDRL
ncbi:MAG: CpsD/CapB family tyrosine-protein kinase [Nitrospirota bacterium]